MGLHSATTTEVDLRLVMFHVREGPLTTDPGSPTAHLSAPSTLNLAHVFPRIMVHESCEMHHLFRTHEFEATTERLEIALSTAENEDRRLGVAVRQETFEREITLQRAT